jgi:putative endonuclease
MARTYCVYILASRSRNLYTGVTNNLQRRMFEHRQGIIPGFTSRYRIFRLVHFEQFGDIRLAITREKEIKAWRREKKVWLIERHNPVWQDLAPMLGIAEKQIPHRRSPRTGDRVRDDNWVKPANGITMAGAIIGEPSPKECWT